MSAPAFDVAPLAAQAFPGFACGNGALDRYLSQQAATDVRRGHAACFLAVEAKSGKPAGYYTLSAVDILLPDLPEKLARGLRGRPLLPVARLGRLAVDRSFQGRGLGAALLVDAARRCLQSQVPVFALLSEARSLEAKTFCRRHGFLPLGSANGRLFAPLASFAALLNAPDL
ncbi:GNAT family N-acetyltransferase [Afifella pfennigii]|uniref:GNAT family N-acetyltransferase n=1 Tax=Afifella pfennigii TaxID=209897 RepID=UPI00047A54C8|nr:GNAT family N-acetyltransferase [Afifella pfennigii]